MLSVWRKQSSLPACALATLVIGMALLLPIASGSRHRGRARNPEILPDEQLEAGRSVGGKAANPKDHPYIVTFWRPTKGVLATNDPWDGKLAGFGLRVHTYFVLTSIKTFYNSLPLAADYTEEELKANGGFPPDTALWQAADEIDTDAGLGSTGAYHPRSHINSYHMDLALFQISRYQGGQYKPGDFGTLRQFPSIISPNDSLSNYEKHCYLLSYAWPPASTTGELPDEPASSPPKIKRNKRKFSATHVEMIKYPTPVGKKPGRYYNDSVVAEFEVVHRFSRVCRNMGDVGAPIVCGHPPKVGFIVTEEQPQRFKGENCHWRIQAYRLSNIYEDLTKPEALRDKIF